MDRGGPRVRAAVIGAGISGILSAIKLAEAGLDEITVYEKAGAVGGTWRDNTYPGLACDVPSHLYSYSFAPTPEWSRRYSPGHEIQAYLEWVAREHGVAPRVRFGDEVVRCTHREGTWRIETAAGRRDEAEVVIAATGVLHHPRIPDLPGLDTFGGALFHIGTGSTAVQLVSALVDRVAHLTLFQRTAQWIMPLDNPVISEEERAGLRAHPERLDAIHRELSDLYDLFSNAVVDAASPEIEMVERACLANLEENVHDPVLRERLRPDHRAACKRLIISPDFYRAIQAPQAELVTAAIDRIEPGGVRTADGLRHELDVLVLATGFEVDAFVRPMEVVGRGGRTLGEAWDPRPEAYLAVSVPGFPNFFLVNGPNGPIGNFSLIEVAELQVGYILQLVERLRSGECREICATRRALDEFESERERAAGRTIWATGCRSWYLDDRGIPTGWPWSFTRFRERMRAPDPDAFETA
jgi:cation diffusion facilitator CzcD-associated flavoprotein CzcO